MADDPEIQNTTYTASKTEATAIPVRSLMSSQTISGSILTTDPLIGIKEKTAKTILELGYHTLLMGLSLFSIWLIHLILEGLLGHDAKFFDIVPIRWVVDAGDVVVIGG